MGKISSHHEQENMDIGSLLFHTDGEASQVTTPTRLPNFRRFKTGNNLNADSDTYTEEECGVKNRFFHYHTEDYKDELTFPSSFCNSLAGEFPAETILVSCNGTWVFKTRKCRCHRLFAVPGKVWDSFVSHNNMEQEDIVLFEQTDQMVFTVRIFSKVTTCVKTKLESPDENTKYYSSKGVIKPHHLMHSYPREDGVISRFFRPVFKGFEEELRLAPDFCDGLPDEVPTDTILVSYKGMYSIPTEICKCHGLFVLSGKMWKKFILDHGLQISDLIFFEQTDEMVFKVRVFDCSTYCEKVMLGSPSSSRGLQQRGDIIGNENACFRASIKKHQLTTKKFLTIPAGFVKKYGFGEKERAILVNADGDAWEVELDIYRDTRHPGKVYLQVSMKMRGFFKFHDIKVGDEFLFEVDESSTLTSSSSIVLNVSLLQ